MDEGSIYWALVLTLIIIPGTLGLLAVCGVVLVGVNRGRANLIPIPMVLLAVVLITASNGPVGGTLRAIGVVGIPLGIVLVAFLPARADSVYASGHRQTLTRFFGLYTLAVAILFSIYLSSDPTGCHLGGCGY